MAATGAPTQAEIKTILTRAKSRYDGRNARIKAVQDHRWNLTGPTIPKAFRKTTKEARLPYVRDLLKRGQAILGSQLPKPKVEPQSRKPGDVKNASKRERYLASSYRRMDPKGLTFHNITDALCADGEAVWKLSLRMSEWAGEERDSAGDEEDETYLARVGKIHREHYPICWEHVDTQTFYPIRQDHDGFIETVEISTRETYAVLDELGVKYEYENGKYRLEDLGPVISPAASMADPIPTVNLTDTCEYSEHYNMDHVTYSVDGVKIKSEKHPFRRPPYYNPLFSPTSAKDPQYRTEGLADGILQLQDHLEWITTIRLNWASLTGFPTGRIVPVTEDATLAGTEQSNKVVWEQGGIVKAPDGFKFEWVPTPGTGQELGVLQDFFKDLTDDVSLAPILYGEAQGDLSGPAAQSLIAMARAIFGPASDNLQTEFNRMASDIQWLIENVIKDDVPVFEKAGKTATEKKAHPGGWIELGPDDIDGYYEVEHEMAPVVAIERMSKAIWLADAWARGGVDAEYYREEGLGINDPEEMDRRVRTEKLRDSQPYTDALIMKFMERVSSMAPPQAQPQLQQMLQPGQPGAPPAGIPVQPGGPGIPMVAGVGDSMQPGMPGPIGGAMAQMPSTTPPGMAVAPGQMG